MCVGAIERLLRGFSWGLTLTAVEQDGLLGGEKTDFLPVHVGLQALAHVVEGFPGDRSPDSYFPSCLVDARPKVLEVVHLLEHSAI